MVGHRTSLERLWGDRCSVYIRDKKTDPITKITGFIEVPLFQDQPCKLSFEAISSSNGDGVASVSQSVKLFLSLDVAIPPGSKISVARKNQLMEYAQSGQPAIFSSHQEIQLELFKGWA